MVEACTPVSVSFHAEGADAEEAVALGAVRLGDGTFGVPRSMPKARFRRWLGDAQALPKPTASLSSLLREAASVMQAGGPPPMEVICEIEEAHLSSSGNAHLRLRDGEASCRALTWRDGVTEAFGAQGLPEPGTQGIAVVSLQLSPAWGLRLMLSQWRTTGKGEQKGKHEVLAEMMSRDGLLQARKSMSMPDWLTRAAVIAPDGAGLEDMEASIQALERSGLLVLVRRIATFEGAAAAASLEDALNWVATMKPQAVFMVRGGGAPSSLSWLDDERVLRAAAALPMPLITGLGHERDHPLLEQLAVMAAGTPSKAAQFMADACVYPLVRARGLLGRISEAGQRIASDGEAAANAALHRTVAAAPATVLARGYAAVHDVHGRLVTAPVKGRVFITLQGGVMEAIA